ncbi:RING-H2 finger protein ATL70-like [Abrus precatorius]|uniref:RING-H2 finger protein ATL70-like n=1 Tax=Abrus precatorius TaxID=3816 RepID=A0A8B8MBZ7_ABRPR|nr:RING-H2 finger protein ATL70-like [Abrus precatorius]
MNSSTNNDDGGFDTNGFTYGLVFVIGLIFLLLSVAFACFRLRMSRGPNMLNILAGFAPSHGENRDPVGIMDRGLHQYHIDTSFESYPKLLFSQIEKNKGGSNNMISSSCSICLGDYKESDMLRLLPDCGHLFHLDCVDPWLMLHSTCPICRKSSVQASNSASN